MSGSTGTIASESDTKASMARYTQGAAASMASMAKRAEGATTIASNHMASMAKTVLWVDLVVIFFVTIMGLTVSALYVKQHSSCSATNDKNAKSSLVFVQLLLAVFCIFGVGSVVGFGYKFKNRKP